jgi:RNA polymerase sigma factor (sigma-70 family)
MLRLKLGKNHKYFTVDDVYQEAVFQAWLKCDTFRGECTPQKWFLKIAVNRLIEKLRRKEVNTLDIDLSSNPDLATVQPFDHGSDLQMEQLEEQIVRTVGTEALELLRLRFVDGYSTEEVAEIAGLRCTTLKVKMHRTNLVLRSVLKR